MSEKLRRIFCKHDIRERLVYPKDKMPKYKLSNVVYVVQCSEECSDLYWGDYTTAPQGHDITEEPAHQDKLHYAFTSEA